MFDSNFKCLSFQLFIFPVVALILAPSLAMSQERQVKEVLVDPISSAEVVLDVLDVSGRPEVPSPGIRAEAKRKQGDVGLMTQTEIVPGKGEKGKNSENALLGMTAMLVPHVAIICGLIVGLGLIRLMLRWREFVHQEHLAAIEKGIRWGQMSRQGLMLWGMLWVGLGLAVGAALWVNFAWSNAMWGLIPLLLGFALLIYVGLVQKVGSGPETQVVPTM